MKIWLDVVVFELLGEILGFLLAIEEGNDNGVYCDAFVAEELDKAQDLGLVGNHVVGADFGVLDGISINTENNFGIVFEFLEEPNFEVGEESWERTRSVLVVDELAAKLQIELVEHLDALFDFLFLDFEIFLRIETFLHNTSFYYNIITRDGDVGTLDVWPANVRLSIMANCVTRLDK